MKGQRVVEVDAQLIVELLKECAPGRGMEVTKDALPDDATAQFVYYDADRGVTRIYCTSDAWQARETEFKTVTPPTLTVRYGSSTWNYPLSMWADRVRELFAVLRGSEAPKDKAAFTGPWVVIDWSRLLTLLDQATNGERFACPTGAGCTLLRGHSHGERAVFHCSETQPTETLVLDEGSNLYAPPAMLKAFIEGCHRDKTLPY